MLKNIKLLIINQDQDFIDNFIYRFKTEQYEISQAHSIKEGIETLRNDEFDLVIIDMYYKDGTGRDLKRKMNELGDIPTIVVAECNDPNEKVLVLEYGCDDFIEKPFYLLELKARIRAVLRRVNRTESKAETVEVDNSLNKSLFEFNILGRKVKVDDVELDLTGKEFDLLYVLVSNKNKIFTRKNLADEIWKGISDSNIRTVDVHIRRLREKLEDTRAHKFIKTSWGEGYYFDDTIEEKRN